MKSKVQQFKDSTLFKFALANKLLVLGFLVSVIVVIFLTSTKLKDAIYFNDPAHKDVQLEAWMTPRYVALSYDLPREVMMDLINIDDKTKIPRRMDHLAEMIGLSLGDMAVKVRQAAISYRAENSD